MVGTKEKQIEFEEEIRGNAIRKYLDEINKSINDNMFASTNAGTLLLKASIDLYSSKLLDFFRMKHRGQTEKDKNLLRLFFDDVDVLSVTVISICLNMLAGSKKDITITNLSIKIIKELSAINLAKNIKEDNKKFLNYLGTEFKRANARTKAFIIKKQIQDLKDFDTYNKDKIKSVRIGALLIELLIESGADLINTYKSYKNQKSIYCVKLSSDAISSIIYACDVFSKNIMMTTTLLPMIIEPEDFSTETLKGGYINYPIDFIKFNNKAHKNHVMTYDLTDIIAIANKVQKTPWRFNKRMIEVIKYITDNNLEDVRNTSRLPKLFAELPSLSTYNINSLVNREEFGVVEDGWKMEKGAYHMYNKTKNELMIEIDTETGKRLSLFYALNIYDKLKDYDYIYFPLQLDYRGRAYYHTAFLSPQQPAYIKAMLEFGNGKKLNTIGEEGLKIHIANCYGLDKKLFSERIDWVDNNESMILNYAENWKEYMYEWTQSDSPLEFLASCFAYKDFKDGLDIHLPIGLDSTCSGIQMYSGLLFDREGAETVNVINSYIEVEVDDDYILQAGEEFI